jgi:hypothetical protein
MMEMRLASRNEIRQSEGEGQLEDQLEDRGVYGKTILKLME